MMIILVFSLISLGLHSMKVGRYVVRPVHCGDLSLWESGETISHLITDNICFWLGNSYVCYFSAVGAVATWSGARPSVSATSQRVGTCVWTRRKVWWFWIQRRQTPNCLPSVSEHRRSVWTLNTKISILPVLLDSYYILIAFLFSLYFSLPVVLIPGEQEKVEGTQKKRDVEGMGIPEIKYGESMCFMQHHSTGLWLTYAALDAKAARLGTMKRRVWSSLTFKSLGLGQYIVASRIEEWLWYFPNVSRFSL